MAIMGFCAIYQFDFIVERLGAEATLFVNRVAGLVHENVALWKGACNKNLGRCWGGSSRLPGSGGRKRGFAARPLIFLWHHESFYCCYH